MRALKRLFENNERWASLKLKGDPNYFRDRAKEQDPLYLWIGCSDSRVPANEIVGLEPGELFVHRNIANLVLHTDFNALSVLEFAVDILKIQHVIVCGHYGCGGIRSAMENRRLGLVDHWLRDIRDTHERFQKELEQLQSEQSRFDRLVELNIFRQVLHVCHTPIVQNAWERKQPLWVHGWVYDIRSGSLRDFNLCINSVKTSDALYTEMTSKIGLSQ